MCKFDHVTKFKKKFNTFKVIWSEQHKTTTR